MILTPFLLKFPLLGVHERIAAPSLPPFFPSCIFPSLSFLYLIVINSSLSPSKLSSESQSRSSQTKSFRTLFPQHSGLDSAHKKRCPRLRRQKEGKAIFLWGFLQTGMWAGSRKIYSSFWESSCKSSALVLQSREIIRNFPMIPTHLNVLKASSGFSFTLVNYPFRWLCKSLIISVTLHLEIKIPKFTMLG